jgi:hypothetical protein
MGPCLRPRLLTACVTGLACACLAGCFGAYLLPTVALTPSLRMPAGVADVYVVRVDVADDENCDDLADHDRYVLHPVPLQADGSVLAQVQLGIDHGWLWKCVVSYGGRTHRTMIVRVYRPGWETVEIRSWQLQGRRAWKEAPDPGSQEKAVDDLVSTWETDCQGYSYRKEKLKGVPRPPDATLFRCLAPGSASKAHRAALRFAASEYDRLALLVPVGDEEADDYDDREAARARLTAKARALRHRAAH